MEVIVGNALNVARDTGSDKVLLFLDSVQEVKRFCKIPLNGDTEIVLVLPRALEIDQDWLGGRDLGIIRCWSGNQTRFSRIKYAFLSGVMEGRIRSDGRIVCVLGPAGKSHLDTITIHDLALSWSEEFPFQVEPLVKKRSFYTVMAVVDIALDIGALGREGTPVGTVFVIGDTESVLKMSHQAVFNPFRGYPKKERLITLPEVVESLKELAKLDGAIIVSEDGVVEAAGRMLDARARFARNLRGLGSRHRAAAAITRKTDAVAVAVSESTGKVTIFDQGVIVSALEPLISRRMV